MMYNFEVIGRVDICMIFFLILNIDSTYKLYPHGVEYSIGNYNELNVMNTQITGSFPGPDFCFQRGTCCITNTIEEDLKSMTQNAESYSCI